MGHSYDITFETKRSRDHIARVLERVTDNGPFRVEALGHVGPDWWVTSVRRADPAVIVGFAKVAELLALLAREFEIHAVQRAGRESGAVAS